MLTLPLPSVFVAELPPRSDDDQPPASPPQDVGGNPQQEIDADAHVVRQLVALGAANMAGMMTAQTVVRHVLKPKHMHDAWAVFMVEYRAIFHSEGYRAADTFARREAIRLLHRERQCHEPPPTPTCDDIGGSA